MDIRNLSAYFRKGNLREVEKSYGLFQEGVRCTEECDIWRGKENTASVFLHRPTFIPSTSH